MVENKQDILARAYAMLKSLRENIDRMTDYYVPETYFREFDTVLDKLEGVGIDVAEFRIPDSAVKPKITASWLSGGQSHHSYSQEKYVEKSLLSLKLDAILFLATLKSLPLRSRAGLAFVALIRNSSSYHHKIIYSLRSNQPVVGAESKKEAHHQTKAGLCNITW